MKKLNKSKDFVEYSKSDPRIKKIGAAIQQSQRKPDALIEVLHVAQGIFGYLPLGLLQHIAKEMRIPPSRVYGVATFYYYFSLKPKGEHNCLVCTGTACYVKGAEKLIAEIGNSFSIKPGETTPDNHLGLQTARCIGSCGLAPAVVLDDEILAKVEVDKVADLIRSRIKKA